MNTPWSAWSVELVERQEAGVERVVLMWSTAYVHQALTECVAIDKVLLMSVSPSPSL